MLKNKKMFSVFLVFILSSFFVSSIAVASLPDLFYSRADVNWVAASNNAIEIDDDKRLPIQTEKYNGKPVEMIHLTAGGYAWWIVQYKKEGIDLTKYIENGVIEFAMKGEQGGEKITVGFRSGDWAAGTLADALVEVVATKDWKVHRIPVKEVVAVNEKLNLADGGLFTFRDHNEDKLPLKVFISDVKIVIPKAAPQTVPSPKTGDPSIVLYMITAFFGLALLFGLRKIRTNQK